MAITPVPVQAFQITQTVTSGTYPLITGVANQQIRILSYNISSTNGTLTIRDTSGVVVCVLTGGSSTGYSGIKALTVGAGLEAVVSDTTDVSCYFTGFLA